MKNKFVIILSVLFICSCSNQKINSHIEYELNFLKENMEVSVLMYGSEILGVDLPSSVELLVTETEPGVKGDTATGATKLATLETGYSLQVPLFIKEGDKLIINTAEGHYISRA